MSNYERYEMLPGSLPCDLPADACHEVSDNEPISLTLQLRRKNSLKSRVASDPKMFISHAELEHNHGARFDDIMLVFEFAHHFGLGVERVHVASRTIELVGSASNVCRAFRLRLLETRCGRAVYHAPDGPVLIPAELSAVVTAVIGMDNRPKAKPHFRVALAPATFKPTAFTGNQLADIYSFPASTGNGETVGLLELGGGYNSADLSKFCQDLGLPVPSVKSVSVGHGKNAPGQDDDADIEVALDLEVVASICPGANIVFYFAENTEQGFLQAVLACIHDTDNKPGTLSISWGADESNWSSQSMKALDEAFQSAAALGISVTVAAGDDGANDNGDDGKQHVDFPASSPSVLSCGGTTLALVNGKRQEKVWNDGDGSATGGGISSVFPRPAYQSGVVMPANLNGSLQGRGVPDVAAVADPATGYSVYVNGRYLVVGGTSAVAPLYAALITRLNALSGESQGLINPTLYGPGGGSVFNDITEGNNSCDGVTGYQAAQGWDPVTGFGSPNGILLQQLLASKTQ